MKKLPNLDLDFHTIKPFDDRLINFCQKLSKALFELSDIKKYHDLPALAFWLRKSNILKFKKQFLSHNKILVPRGLVFHIPPSNVDTMFVYSWILSLLVGNGNIVRIPSKKTASIDLLLKAIIANLGPLTKTNFFISYGHEVEITSHISEQADVRVIWGGDNTVNEIRKIPLKPLGKDVVFPDRFAFAAIESVAYKKASDGEKNKLAKNFFNDFSLFDQAACSSPKAVFWIGGEIQAEEFDNYLHSIIKQQGHSVPLNGFLQKNTHLYKQVSKLPVMRAKNHCNELSSLTLKNFNDDIRTHPGFGLIYHIPIKKLDDLKKQINKKDQTMLHYGFPEKTLLSFIKSVNGRGIDRVVPIGQALNFDNIWDGFDLMLEFSKVVFIN